ncbi:MAG: AI-2E family transporter [Pseudomonadota bacterium]|nr:AI-2E family transporter [Pseudomonadota bacterium]
MSDSQKWLLALAVVTLALLAYLLGPVLTPFLVAAGLAYLGDPLADRLEARGLSRSMAVVVVFFCLTVVVLVAIVIIVPVVQNELVVLGQKLPGYIDWLQKTVLPWLQARVGIALPELGLDELKGVIADHWKEVGGVASWVMASVTSSSLVLLGFFANLVLIPVLTFYLLRDWDVMMARIHELLPQRYERRAVRLARECDEMLGAFMHGQLLVMVALGLIYSVGLWLVGLDMAFIIGMLAGVVSFVPYLGFIVGMVVAGIAAAVQFQELLPLVYVLMVFGVGQMLESFLLTPYLLGDRIGLHPVAVIFAVMAGGQLFGFVGVLLALPATAVLMVIVRQSVEYYLDSQAQNGIIKQSGDIKK